MPFPFVFHENFELGTLGGFTSEVDTDGKLDFPDHNDDLDVLPWRGGYVMRVNLDRSTTDAYVEQNAVMNMTTGVTRYLRFYLRASPDFKMPFGTGNSLKIFRVFSAGSPDKEEVSIGITRSESQIYTTRLSIGSPDDGEFIEGLNFVRDVWLPIQITISHNTTTGRVWLHVGDNTVQVARMQMDPFIYFRLGAMAQSPKVRGTLYFDDFLIDTQKLEEPSYIAPSDIWGESILYTKDTYAFVGPGTIRGATLISGGTNNLVYLFDADRLPVAHHDIRASLKCAAAESRDVLVDTIRFKRGCYIKMTGTNPQVIVHYGTQG